MKKITLLTALAISTITLVACQQKQEQTTSTSVEQASSSPVKEKVKIDYTLYDSVLAQYGKVLHKENTNGLDINNLANLVTTSMGFYTGIEYSQYDLDKNGTDDLLIILVSKEGGRSLLDVRTIVDGKVVRLTNQANQLDMIGERMFLTPLEDGTFLYKGSSSALDQTYAHYKFNSAGMDLEKVAEGKDEAELGQLSPALDFSKLDWKSVAGNETNSTDTASQETGMDITAIQHGDYSSIAGTWTNGEGMTLTFDKNGLVSDTSMVSLDYASVVDGFLKASISGKSGGAGGMAIAFLPVGTGLTESVTGSPNSGFADPSNITKDRIWAGQQVIQNESTFYYKVQ